MISAEVICDSVSEQGKRLTTFKLRYPKFIHGEFMTHRVISRNASSSRAIPTAKLLEEVRSDVLRAGPVFWGKNQSGMQAAEELSKVYDSDLNSSPRQRAILLWRRAAYDAANCAEELLKIGAHKQIVNRLLEPFSHINVVATATEWDNFFGLRLHKDAQPEMRALAIAMWEARKISIPKLLKPGEWHLPFVWQEGGNAILLDDLLPPGNPLGLTPHEQMIRISVARCARVSYETFETGKRSTVEEDLKLYERLASSGHWSPFEHQATPDTLAQYSGVGFLWRHNNNVQGIYQHGNLVGWRQNRKLIAGEAVAPIPEEFR